MILVPPPPPSSFPLTLDPNHPLRHRFRQLPATSRCRRLPNLPLQAATSRGVDAFTKNSGYLFELSNSEADSLTEYNISKIGSIYRNKPLVVLRRLFQIGTSLGKWLLLRYLDSITERSEETFKVKVCGNVQNKGWTIENVDFKDTSVPEKVRIRGFRINKVEQLEKTYSEPGKFFLKP